MGRENGGPNPDMQWLEQNTPKGEPEPTRSERESQARADMKYVEDSGDPEAAGRRQAEESAKARIRATIEHSQSLTKEERDAQARADMDELEKGMKQG